MGSTLQCLHQGMFVLVASQNQLTVDGQAVLVDGDLEKASITGCTNIGPGLKPCLKVTSVLVGKSTNLSVGDKPVLVDTATGMTDGTIAGTPQTWNVTSAGQQKLTAV
jgi:hypothetical protein